MKIIAVSDTHGRLEYFEKLRELHRDADYFLHLGDGYAEVRYMRAKYPDFPLIAVGGNCDPDCPEPERKLLRLEGMTVFLTHGHRYGVKWTTLPLETAARAEGADVVLFGHTHRAVCSYKDGLWMANPGSLGRPSDGVHRYVVVNSTKNGAYCHLAAVE